IRHAHGEVHGDIIVATPSVVVPLTANAALRALGVVPERADHDVTITTGHLHNAHVIRITSAPALFGANLHLTRTAAFHGNRAIHIAHVDRAARRQVAIVRKRVGFALLRLRLLR